MSPACIRRWFESMVSGDVNSETAISSARGPLRRTMARAPGPAALASAIIVSLRSASICRIGELNRRKRREQRELQLIGSGILANSATNPRALRFLRFPLLNHCYTRRFFSASLRTLSNQSQKPPAPLVPDLGPLPLRLTAFPGLSGFGSFGFGLGSTLRSTRLHTLPAMKYRHNPAATL